MQKYSVVIFILFLITSSSMSAHNKPNQSMLIYKQIMEEHLANENQKQDTEALFRKIELALKALGVVVDFGRLAYATGYPLEFLGSVVGGVGSTYLLYTNNQWHSIKSAEIISGLGSNALPLAILAVAMAGSAYGANKLKKCLFGKSKKQQIVGEVDSGNPGVVTIKQSGMLLRPA